MKHCPECNRNYADPTISFCLNDGAPLIFGEAVEESPTAILTDEGRNESPTRILDPHTTAPTESFPFPVADAKQSRAGGWKLPVLVSLALLLLGAAGVIAYLYLEKPSNKAIQSIAVLPFQNGSGSQDLEFLSDGLSAMLIDKLSQLPQLKVISRTSSFKFRDPNPDIQDIAAKLGVQAVVTGQVAKQGETLTVRVEMIDAKDNTQIWGEQFARKANDAVEIQQEIAQTVLQKLKIKLSSAQEQSLARVGTTNPDAYELFLQGKVFHDRGGIENRKKANQYFEQAIAKDPNYALPYAYLSRSYLIMAGNGVGDPKEFDPKAEAAAQQALRLDPTQAEAHLAMASVYLHQWKWDNARGAIERAIEFSPNSERAYQSLAFYHSIHGRHVEAVAEARRALELDPVSLGSLDRVALTLCYARQFDESIETAKKVIELDPKHGYAYTVLGYSYAGAGRFREAINTHIESAKIDAPLPSDKIFLGAAYANAGERAKAIEILNELRSTREYVSPGELPVLLVALGDKEAAFASLEGAYEAHDLQLLYLKADPAFDPLRDDPRFADLLRRIGLPQ